MPSRPRSSKRQPRRQSKRQSRQSKRQSRQSKRQSRQSKRQSRQSKRQSKRQSTKKRRSKQGRSTYRSAAAAAELPTSIIVSAKIHNNYIEQLLQIEGNKKYFVWCPYNFKGHERNAWKFIRKDVSTSWPGEWVGAMTTIPNQKCVAEYFNNCPTKWPDITNINVSNYSTGNKVVDKVTMKQFERIVSFGRWKRVPKYEEAIKAICNPEPVFDEFGLLDEGASHYGVVGWEEAKNMKKQYTFKDDAKPIINLYNNEIRGKEYTEDKLLKDDTTYEAWTQVVAPDDEDWILMEEEKVEEEEVERENMKRENMRELKFDMLDLTFIGEESTATREEIIKEKGTPGNEDRGLQAKFKGKVTIFDYVTVTHGNKTIYLKPNRKTGGDVNFRIDNAMKRIFASVNGVYTDAMASLYIIARDSGIPIDEIPVQKPYINSLGPGIKEEYNKVYDLIPKLKNIHPINKRVHVIIDYEMDDIMMLRFLSHFYTEVHVQFIEHQGKSQLVEQIKRQLTKKKPDHVTLVPGALTGEVNLGGISDHYKMDGVIFEEGVEALPWKAFATEASIALTSRDKLGAAVKRKFAEAGSKELTVHLGRQDAGFGIDLTDDNIITKVQQGGSAHGKLQEGDQVIAVDGDSLTDNFLRYVINSKPKKTYYEFKVLRPLTQPQRLAAAARRLVGKPATG